MKKTIIQTDGRTYRVMKWWPPERTWLLSIIAGVCLWLSPFVVFARDHSYELWRPEILLAFALLALFGVLSGLLMETLGQYTRPLIWAALVTLTVDIQMVQEERAVILWIVFAAGAAFFFLVRNYLPRFGVIVAGAVLLVGFFTPTGTGEVDIWVADTKPTRDPSLPVFLHIILDEQIGVEGIPKAFDKNGEHARGLRDFYLKRGFQVFGRAYSQFYTTWGSLGNAFNFDYRGISRSHYDSRGKFHHLKRNAYFDLMKKRGYEIQVFQVAYLDYAYDKAKTPVSKSVTYGLEKISAIEGSDLPIGAKLRIIFGVYSRLSHILGDLKAPPSRLSTLSAMKMLEQVESTVAEAEPGMMFVVHLLLPHYPYTFDADCNMYGDPWKWLMGSAPDLGRLRNTAESRAERYPLYLEQIGCLNKKLGEMFDTFEQAGLYDDMIILVHGDHGSRICRRPPNRDKSGFRISKADYIDSFSALFAFKYPGVPAIYDRRMLPLGSLLESVIKDGYVPDGEEWVKKRDVYFHKANPNIGARKMPEFQRSLDD